MRTLWRTSVKASRYMWFFATCTKTFAGPQTKSFFGREHFETTVCAPYDSVALELGGMCGHLNGPPAAQDLSLAATWGTFGSGQVHDSDLNGRKKFSCPNVSRGFSIKHRHDRSF